MLELISLAKGERELRSLEVEMYEKSARDAIAEDLPPEWLSRYQKLEDYKDTFLSVSHVSANSPNADLLKRGDIILSMENKEVTRFRQTEKYSQQETIRVEILREGEVIPLTLESQKMYGTDVDSIIAWSGAIIHKPHRSAQIQRGIKNEGLWIAFYFYGSPANRYGFRALSRIIEVDGVPVKTENDFIQAVQDKKHQESLRLKLIDMNDQARMITIKVDKHYWPSFIIEKTTTGWEKKSF
jgi:S1-C subfamily serine protease